MIDGIKFRLPEEYISSFLTNPLLNPLGRYKLKTGEGIPDKFSTEYKCFTIDINSKVVRIRGSLHKYAQNGHNYREFNLDSVKRFIGYLSDELDFDPEDTILENLEIGVNLNTSFKVDDWLKNGIIVYKNFKPRREEDHKSKGYYLEFRSKKYWRIKIYDKGRQYGIEENLLRFEKRYESNKEIFTRLGIKTLNDLLSDSFYNTMLIELNRTLDNLLSIDQLDFDHVDDQGDREFLTKYSNPSNWTVKMSAVKRKRLKERFNKLAAEYDLQMNSKEVRYELNEKWSLLLNNETNMPLSKGLSLATDKAEDPRHEKQANEVDTNNPDTTRAQIPDPKDILFSTQNENKIEDVSIQRNRVGSRLARSINAFLRKVKAIFNKLNCIADNARGKVNLNLNTKTKSK